MIISKLLKKIKKISKKLNKKIFPMLALAPLLGLQIPHVALAQILIAEQQNRQNQVEYLGFPENGPRAPQEIKYLTLTAYNSLASQTDDRPCEAASGLDLCANNQENVIAINGLPFGTLIRFPELYGDKTFKVLDRMNSRYTSSRADIWLKNLSDAKEFGIKRRVKTEIL
ncbi:MAG: hypothetical protein NTV81_03550 [Candidatus Komeilibacteria bacterium]|nr:hypothetical protein [Candidatus Komeilibacteria bacterium]